MPDRKSHVEMKTVTLFQQFMWLFIIQMQRKYYLMSNLLRWIRRWNIWYSFISSYFQISIEILAAKYVIFSIYWRVERVNDHINWSVQFMLTYTADIFFAKNGIERAGPQMPTTKNIERQMVSVGDPISQNSTSGFTWDRIQSKTLIIDRTFTKK